MYDVEEDVEFLLELAGEFDKNNTGKRSKLIEISKKLLEMSVKLNNGIVTVDWKNPQTYEPNRTNTTPFVINPPYLTCTPCESEGVTFSTTTTNNKKE